MANDIQKSVTSNVIKNGTIVVSTCAKNGNTQTIDSYVSNKPTISDIESKYDNRFDDPSYYFGIGDDTLIGG